MESNPSLLVGNGFNMALSSCIGQITLDYESISKEVRKRSQKLGNGLYEFLEKNKTECDLELLLSILNNSLQCLKSSTSDYCTCKSDYKEKIKLHRSTLKELVIEIMTSDEFHPQHSKIFSENSYLESCKKNLEAFDRIFTINYDLILYWLLNKKHLLVETDENGEVIHGKFKDGFSSRRELRPINDDNNEVYEHLYGYAGTNNHPNLYFLHGALHLLQKNGYAYKVVKNGSQSHLNILELRNTLINDYNDFDNLIVFDATSHNKIRNIYSNAYLEKAYDKIITIPNDMVIYGCNVLDKYGEKINLGNDIHLWRRIINSRSKKIYVGISKEDNQELNQFACDLAKELRGLRCIHDPEIDIYCFPQCKVNIWNSKNFYSEVVSNSSKGYSAALKD
ncbi:TPA: DUF4917 family protein [Legionella pneumophila]